MSIIMYRRRQENTIGGIIKIDPNSVKNSVPLIPKLNRATLIGYF